MSLLTVVAIIVGYFIGSLISMWVLDLSSRGTHWPLIIVVLSIVAFLSWVLLQT